MLEKKNVTANWRIENSRITSSSETRIEHRNRKIPGFRRVIHGQLHYRSRRIIGFKYDTIMNMPEIQGTASCRCNSITSDRNSALRKPR